MGVDSPIHAQNVPNASSGSRPDSLGNEDDPIMGEIDVHTASLARAKFNLSSVLSRMAEHKTGCFLQSLEKASPAGVLGFVFSFELLYCC